MIFGRNEINGVTFSEAKKMKVSTIHSKSLREDDITFTEKNADGLLLPYNDALELVPTPELEEVSPGIEASEHYQVPRYFQVPEETDAIKSTAEELEWTLECQQALRDLKRYLSSPPLLSKPKEGEILLVYLAISEVAKLATHIWKPALALVVVTRKLRPYFQCHLIAMVTTFPLRNILCKPELSGILAKWAVEMSEFDIEYKLMVAIKSRALADIVADFSPGLLTLATKEAIMVSESTSGVSTLFMDGASSVKGFELRIVLITPSGETLRQAIRTIPLTNNEAEYEALIAGLKLTWGLESEVIEIKCDSQLVVNQVYGIFDIKEESMQQYVIKVQALLARFREWSITHIPMEDNAEVDAFTNLGSSTKIKGLESGTVVQLMNSVLDTDGYYEVNSTSLFWD
uniref:Uncharacterized protein LOC104216682 n=2 Tax=Nicotiana sylvestris TaxID=4096 RepID=A0A1U7VT45_NICSY|nr:PREDICTED: uncharacterized protein LOC104216682 [Nicotiana sylvestris]